MRPELGWWESAWHRDAWWLRLLRPLEIVFRGIAALRRQLYSCGLLARYRPGKPVVIVGNITVGGTGKTPVVIALVKALRQRGIKVGVVSRGYGATAGLYPHTVSAHSSASDCGDEPLLIYQRTRCPCVVAPSRPAAVRALLDSYEVDVVLADDGLQHYALARDMEIAVLDKWVGYGNGFCLPAGPLREPIGRLKSVDFVLYRGSDDPVSGVYYEPDSLVNLATGEQLEFSLGAVGNRVYAVAGIGQPSQFFAMLRQRGFQIEAHAYADHYDYRPADLAALHDRPIIMTEKDAVKCRVFAAENVWYLKISAHLPEVLPKAVETLVNRWEQRDNRQTTSE